MTSLQMNMKNTRNKDIFYATIGAAIGVIAFLLIHTAAPLDVTYDAYILDGYVERDIVQHYTGWLFYRQAPLSFPLGVAPAMGAAVTFTDSIPLFSIPLRFIEALLPPVFQFFGWFSLISYGAMGSAAALLLNLFMPQGKRGAACTFLGTCLFVTYPIMVERTFRHTSLTAQCLIVFALYIYFSNAKFGYKNRLAYTALCVISACVHPYFAPMVFAVLFADLAQNTLAQKSIKTAINSALFLCFNIGITLITLFCIGALFGNATGDLNILYGYFTMNLNSVYNPLSLGHGGELVWSRFILPRAQGYGTYDGFNYMGFGVLAFMAAAVIGTLITFCKDFYCNLKGNTSADKKQSGLVCKVVKAAGNTGVFIRINRHIALLLVCVILTLFALTNKVILGNLVIFEVPLPSLILELANNFRSSGRMFWPVNYLVLTGVVVFFARVRLPKICVSKAQILKTANKYIGAALVFALVALQIADISPALMQKRDAFVNPQAEFETPLKSTAWQTFAENYGHIVALDPTLSNGLYLALYTAQNSMTTTDSFTSRIDVGERNEEIAREIELLKSGQAADDTIYITTDGFVFSQLADEILAADDEMMCMVVDDNFYVILRAKDSVRQELVSADNIAIYPDIALKTAIYTDPAWENGVLREDKSTVCFYNNDLYNKTILNMEYITLGDEEYAILDVDTGDEGWIIVTLDIEDATILIGEELGAH